MLFEPLRIAGFNLPNRIVMAPMGTNSAEPDYTVSKHQIEYYELRAKGGVGLIIVEATFVNSKGAGLTPERATATRPLAVYDDKFIPPLRKLADAIKDQGAIAGIQLNDARFIVNGNGPADLTVEEVEKIIDDFVNATCRVAEAGFDVVEFHMAHRYTLATFLSKRANNRTDEYGANVAGRCRVSESILRRVKAALGNKILVICRINGDEFQIGGNTLKDAKLIAQRFALAGTDVIHVSAGGRIEDGGDRSYSCFRQNPTQEFPDGVNVYLAEGVKRVVNVPVIAVGKIRTPELAESILLDGKADLIALGRPLMADADFAKKALEGRSGEIVRCLSCNDCLRLVFRDKVAECTRGQLSVRKDNKKS